MKIERSRITGKGQVQVPAKIRKAINAEIGDELAFMVDERGEVKVKLVKKRKISEFAGVLRKRRKYVQRDKERQLTKTRVAERVAREHEQQ
ncbi:MAG TPA: AbrB family transcriptional regulator [Kosmotogaceae bacterium]|nr:AbrB family transcriptional regulator [Kosmotogaceae bacterium]